MFDPERLKTIVDKSMRIRVAIESEGVAETSEKIPFEMCDCYFCSQEILNFH